MRLVIDALEPQRINDVPSGFPRSASVTESLGFYLSAGGRFVSVRSPSTSASDLVPFWVGPLRRLSPSSLTTFSGGSLSLTLSIQPSASFGFVFRNHARPPHGDQRTPLGGYICRALSTVPLPVPHRSVGYRWLNTGPAHPLGGRAGNY